MLRCSMLKLKGAHAIPLKRNYILMGIESSCDDTAVCLMESSGKVLSHVRESQISEHQKTGGIIPKVASLLHRDRIDSVVGRAFQQANITPNLVDVFSVSTCPGLYGCLKVGVEKACSMGRKFEKPIIPIHHMRAHALTPRFSNKSILFPFLCLLMSGGHCLLTFVESALDFVLLGTTLDIAPGDAFDKIARELRLTNLPKFASVHGGKAIEEMAKNGDPFKFSKQISLPFSLKSLNCDFSFSGINSFFESQISESSREQVNANQDETFLGDIAASFQYVCAQHIIDRTATAFYFTTNDIIEKGKTASVFVASGGVASNSYLTSCLHNLCSKWGYTLYVPPAELCTDNAVMIAWNALENIKEIGLELSATKEHDIQIHQKMPIGRCFRDVIHSQRLTRKTFKKYYTSLNAKRESMSKLLTC